MPVAYDISIVRLQIDDVAPLVALALIVPLAFLLSSLLVWILTSLNRSIELLALKRQDHKRSLLLHVRRALLAASLAILAVFVWSAFVYSGRYQQDFDARVWQYAWFLQDGWSALLYLFLFVAIVYRWRPDPSNRLLALSEQIATDEDEAEAFELANTQLETDDPVKPSETVAPVRPDARAHRPSEDHIFSLDSGDDSFDEARPERERGNVARPVPPNIQSDHPIRHDADDDEETQAMLTPRPRRDS